MLKFKAWSSKLRHFFATDPGAWRPTNPISWDAAFSASFHQAEQHTWRFPMSFIRSNANPAKE
jgi:hypothetical protein